MKKNASMLLLELILMLLVFALSAALCLQAFAWAGSRARQSEAEDMALLQAQNAAEILKSGGEVRVLYYDAHWTETPTPDCYCLQAVPLDSGSRLLGKAGITVTDADGAVLAALTVCWQEVAA